MEIKINHSDIIIYTAVLTPIALHLCNRKLYSKPNKNINITFMHNI